MMNNKIIVLTLSLLTITLVSKAQVEIVSSGTSAVYTLAVPGAFQLTNGLQVSFKAHTANSASATLNVSGSGAKSITKIGGSTVLSGSDILTNQIVTVAYDGTNWQMISAIGSTPTASNDWTTTGNAGTNSGANYIGTSDAVDLSFRTNGILKARLTQKGQLEILNTGASLFFGEGAGANEDLNNRQNTFVGYVAGGANTTGNWNTAIGYDALGTNITGTSNTAIGRVALGYSTGDNNTAIGTYALFWGTTGSGNTGTGTYAGQTITNGSNNTFLGYNADAIVNNLTNATAIGANSVVSQSNSLVLGNAANVGIGTSSPTQKLHVTGGQIYSNWASPNGPANVFISNWNSGSGPGYNTGTLGQVTIATSDAAESKYAIQGYAGGDGGSKIGITGSAMGLGNNTGGYFSASGGTNNYAIIVPSTGGNVGIGTTAPATKLDVANSTIATTSRFTNTFSSASPKMAVYGWAYGTGTGNNSAGAFDASGSSGNNYAVYGAASGNSGNKIGVYSSATGTGTNIGGYFSASGGTTNNALQLVDGSQANNRILTSNATGVATWTDLSTLTSGGATAWTRSTPNIYPTTLTDNVGIGVLTPVNKLDVEGAAVIGATFSGTNTAPTNGLLVEGSMGIGTPSPGTYGLYTAIGTSTNKKTLTLSAFGASFVDNAPAVLEIRGGTNTVGAEVGVIDFIHTSNGSIDYNFARISAHRENANATYASLRFYTRTGASLNEAMRINENGKIGIGIKDPIEILEIGSTDSDIELETYSTTESSSLHIKRGRGTLAAPTIPISGDYYGGVGFQAWDGTAFQEGARIQGAVDGTVGATDMPGRLEFWTSPDGSAAAVERMRITNSGNVGIGTATVNNKLDVEGAVAIGATYSGTNTAPTNGLIVEGNTGFGTPTPSYKVHTLLSSGYTALEATSTGVYGMRFISPDRNWYFLLSGGGTTAGSFGIYDGTASAYRMYIDPTTGNTSFGSTSTDEKLNVTGRIYGTAGMHIGLANGNQGLVTLQNNTGSIWSDIFECYTSGLVSAFTVQNSGFVGINDASPSYNLDVTSSSTSYAGRFQNTGTGGADGLNVSVQTVASAAGTRYGILSTVTGGLSSQFGVYGQAYSTGTTNYGVYGYAANGTTNNYGGYFSGNVNVTGALSKGSGTFKIDHPLDPENKILYHSFVESPDMMNVYNGNIKTDANGIASVQLPDYFEALNKDFRYQLTVIGDFAQVIVLEKVNGNNFKIKTDKPNIEVSWQVTGIRKDPFAELNRVIPEVEKTQEEKGFYLYPKAYGKPEEMGVDYRIIKERNEKDKLYQLEIEQKDNNSKEVKEIKTKVISVPGGIDPTIIKEK